MRESFLEGTRGGRLALPAAVAPRLRSQPVTSLGHATRCTGRPLLAVAAPGTNLARSLLLPHPLGPTGPSTRPCPAATARPTSVPERPACDAAPSLGLPVWPQAGPRRAPLASAGSTLATY